MFASGRFAAVPLIGGLHPWQSVFVSIGAIGIVLSLLVLTFNEPPRQRAREENVGFSDALAHMRAHLGSYIAIIVFVTCFSGVSLTYGAWLPTVITRTWHVPPQQVGLIFGPILLVCGSIGAWCGGTAIDMLTRRGRRDAPEIVGIWVTLLYIPLGVATPLVPEVGEMWFGLATQLLVNGAFHPVAASIVARLTPQRLMGKVTATYLLIFTILARAGGPLLVAVMSDHLFSGPQALGFALGTATFFAMVSAFIGIAWLLVRVRQELSASLQPTPAS
jgi:fucose permease